MSVITLQFGQCGNQIGQSLYTLLNDDIKSATYNVSKSANLCYVSDSVGKWFHINKRNVWEPRSILIDTESKVVGNSSCPFKFKNIVAKAIGGSANNWAFGYTSRSEFLLGEVMECVRSEAERCDYMSSFLNVFSSSGGTGSGVGSRIIETIRDEFLQKNIVNAIILPYKAGEVVTQNYNTVLSLAKLYDKADMTILFENDRIHHMCDKLLSMKNVRFEDINSIISQQLGSILQPVSTHCLPSLTADLTAHPSFKLVQMRSAPHTLQEHIMFETTPTWTVLMNSIVKSSRFDYQHYGAREITRPKSVGTVFISRGSVGPSLETLTPLCERFRFTKWLPLQNKTCHYHQNREFINTDRFLVEISNSSNVSNVLDDIINDAWNLFNYTAYLHHYKKFGIEEDFFLNAFQTVETVLYDYKHL